MCVSTSTISPHASATPLFDFQQLRTGNQSSLHAFLDRTLYLSETEENEPITFHTASKSFCVTGLLGGAVSSLLTKHPFFLLLGLSGCFPRVFAQQKVGSEFQVNTYTTDAQEHPSVASFSNGNFIVTWDSLGQDGSVHGVYGQLFNGNGTKVGNEFRVNTYTLNSQLDSSVTSLKDGNFVVAWETMLQDGDNYGIYGQLFNGNGSTIESEFQVNTFTGDQQLYPSVASLNNGNFIAGWQSNLQDSSGWGVYGQLFHENGSKIGNELQLNTYTTDDQGTVEITGLNNENFVATWVSKGPDGSLYGVFGQLFNGTGYKIGNEFQVNTYTADGQQRPCIAKLNNDNFVVIWESRFQDGSEWGVYGQLFDKNANKIGSEFQVSTYTSAQQWYSSVASLRDMNFVVIWESSGQDGSNYGIYGQLLEGNGTKIGNEFRVNTFTANNQVNPSVATLNHNNFIVTWQSELQDGSNYSIYGQLFYDNFSTSTSSTTTSSSTTSTTPSSTSSTTTSSSTTSTTPSSTSSTTTSSSTTSTTPSSTSKISQELASTAKRSLSWVWFLLGGGCATCINLLGYYLFKNRPWQKKAETSLSEEGELQTVKAPESETSQATSGEHQRTPDHVGPGGERQYGRVAEVTPTGEHQRTPDHVGLGSERQYGRVAEVSTPTGEYQFTPDHVRPVAESSLGQYGRLADASTFEGEYQLTPDHVGLVEE